MHAGYTDTFNSIHFLPLPLEVGGTVEGCVLMTVVSENSILSYRKTEKKVSKKNNDLLSSQLIPDMEFTRLLITSKAVEVADTTIWFSGCMQLGS